jgi:trans-aconitate 2-methyltransferase
MEPWNAERYLAYAGLHTQAIEDLLNRVDVSNPRSAVDLGCGPGNSTELIAARWPRAAVTGVDVAAEMLEKAKARHPRWRWAQSGIEEFQPAKPFDVVVACASLQWLRHHERLLPRLWEMVRPGGALAAQMPANQKAPLHRAVFRVARSEKWKPFTGRSRSALNFRSPAEYFAILSPLAPRVDIWESTYYHEMSSLDDLLEWSRHTLMRPFLEKIPAEARRRAFAADVKRACAAAYPETSRGSILYAQKRLFFIAHKSR